MITVDARPEHVPCFMARMDPAERAQLEAMTTGFGRELLERNVRRSVLTWCGLDADGPVTLGGVIPTPEAGTGYLWQVITPAVARNKRAYLRQGRDMQAAALARYPRLVTTISAGYAGALRHARRQGWTIGGPEDMGGTMARRCERTR